MLFARDVIFLFILSNINSVLTIGNHYLPNDDEKLETYSVRNEDLTDMLICVKTLAGKTILLEMDSSDSVENIKEEVEDVAGIPVNQQILVFFGQRLEDRMTLSYYHVTSLSIIHLIQRVKESGGNLPIKHAKEDYGPRSPLLTIGSPSIEVQREKIILEKIPYEFVVRVVTKTAVIIVILCVALGIMPSLYSFR